MDAHYLLLLQKIQKYNTDCYHMKNKFKKLEFHLLVWHRNKSYFISASHYFEVPLEFVLKKALTISL
jgi:hypothetical protein